MPQMNSLEVRIQDPILTRYAQGFTQRDFVGLMISPQVPVSMRGGKVIEFGKEDFAIYDTRRTPGSPMRRKAARYGTQNFDLYQDAIEGELPIEHVEENAAVPVNIRRETVEGARETIDLRLEVDIADLVTTAANYDDDHKETVGASARFDNYGTVGNNFADAVDPIAKVNDWREAIRASIARYPNVGIIGPRVYQKLDRNPWILRQMGVANPNSLANPLPRDGFTASLADLARMFKLRALYVGEAKKLDPLTNELVDVWGDHFVLGYVPDDNSGMMRSRRRPSFCYTYNLNGYPIAEPAYYDRNHRTWYFPVVGERQPVMTAPMAGFLGVQCVTAA